MFLKTSEAILEKIFEEMKDLKSVRLHALDKERTALVIIDMVNGFCKKGTLQSDRIADLIPEIVKLSFKCEDLNIPKIVFADSHSEKSPEFNSYPSHCLRDSKEAEVVDEIKQIGGYKLIAKNSTNGYLEPEFQQWLKENPAINKFIVVGDCTDICILQFAVTLKTHFNRLDQSSRIIVPATAVNTFDLGVHNGDLMQMMALYQMKSNDIEIVKNIIT